MKNTSNLCLRCYEPITNPICEQCHFKEINIWLRDKKINSFIRSIILKAIKENLPYEEQSIEINESQCILCHKHTLTTCSYCFFMISARTLRELNISEKLLRQFLMTFNYRQGHSDYTI
jgi:hypothetical protein